MKYFSKFILFLLILVILSSSLFACAKNNENDNNETPTAGVILETNEYLVKDGKSDYVVVLPDSPVNWESHAANELVDNIFKATSVTLQIKSESEVTDNQKKIVIGNTSFTEQAEVSAPVAEYGARGFVVKEISGNVYIVGGDTQGTLYGVYEFLHQQFGYEPYAIDEIYIETGVTEEKLLAFNMSEIPDIPMMQGIHEYYRFANAAAGHRMRYNTYNEIFIGGDQPWHNVFSYVSKSQLDKPESEGGHPKWFANSEELHYTAHGDLEELKLMQDYVYNALVEKIDKSFAQGKYFSYIGFMQNDHSNGFPTSDSVRTDDSGNPLWEEDEGHVDSVQALASYYGRGYQAAMLVHFLNPIQERISTYVRETYDGRKVSIMFFAYEQTEAAPVDEVNGEFYAKNIITSADSANPIFADDLYKDLYDGEEDGKLKMHPDLTVFMAPIRTEFMREYEEDSMPSIIEKWMALSQHQAYWLYNFYFNSTTFMYYDVAYSAQSYFQAAKRTNAEYLFFESPMTKAGYYHFGNLNVYLFSKLGWNVDVNVQELIDNYFVNYYKQAAGSMRAYFDSLTAHYAYLKYYTGFTGVIGAGSQNLDAKYWPEGVLQGWISLINQALLDIETLKYTDKELYDELYSRIIYESLSPRYLLMLFYSKEAFTDTTFLAELNQFKADAALVEVTKAGSNVPDISKLNLKRG